MADSTMSKRRRTVGPVATLESRLESRPSAGPGWEVLRAIVGIGYLAAAVFNTVYTLPRSDELDGYADGAWFGFLADFMRDVFMPNGELFMASVIVFEIVVGLLVLGRDRMVDVGVVASVLWVLTVLPFLAWPYLVTNVILAIVQAIVLVRRYDQAVWNKVANWRTV